MKEKVNFPIDIVVTWVDQNDKKWKKKYDQYSIKSVDDKAETRFRDYGTLKYLFRSIETFAPWVRTIFLVTDDQIPEWLNLNNSKVRVVSHKEIISTEYLPTFNSNVIDLNLMNITSLSDHFVYFNDDMFLNAPVKPTDFFSETGLPKDNLIFNTLMPTEGFDHIFFNNIKVINSLYDKKAITKKLFWKLFNVKNFEFNFLNMCLIAFPRFSRFVDPHTPISFRKDWIDKELSNLNFVAKQTNSNKFRSDNDYSIWLFRYIALVSGKFSVRSIHFGKGYQLSKINKIEADILKSRHRLININDSSEISLTEFRSLTTKLISAFESKYNSKSTFEK